MKSTDIQESARGVDIFGEHLFISCHKLKRVYLNGFAYQTETIYTSKKRQINKSQPSDRLA